MSSCNFVPKKSNQFNVAHKKPLAKELHTHNPTRPTKTMAIIRTVFLTRACSGSSLLKSKYIHTIKFVEYLFVHRMQDLYESEYV